MSLGPIPEKIRLQMYDWCGGLCEYCASPNIDSNPHHKPYRSAAGAKNDVNHLVFLCRRCHQWAHHQHTRRDDKQYKIFRSWYDNLNIKKDLR